MNSAVLAALISGAATNPGHGDHGDQYKREDTERHHHEAGGAGDEAQRPDGRGQEPQQLREPHPGVGGADGSPVGASIQSRKRWCKVSNQAFDVLRLIGELILPALATLYAALGTIWGWPYIEAIVGTIAAVTAFIGAIANGLRRVYNKKEENNEEDLPESEQSDGE